MSRRDRREAREESGRRETPGSLQNDELLVNFERRNTGESSGERREPRPSRSSAAADRTARRSGSPEGESSGGSSGGLYGSDTGGNILRSAVAELIGTFILVFTGTAVATAALLDLPTAGGIAYDSLAVALAFGVALAIVVASIGHISGAHVNPAVTLSLAATGKFPWSSVPAYVIAQLLGAILGAAGTWVAFGGPGRVDAQLAATFPAEGVGDPQALVVEILITFILVFVITSVATDERVPAPVPPFAVGFALAASVFIAGPVTGGAVNPVRALGPMILSGNFTAAWVYIVGPVIGGVLAALIYDRFISEAGDSE